MLRSFVGCLDFESHIGSLNFIFSRCIAGFVCLSVGLSVYRCHQLLPPTAVRWCSFLFLFCWFTFYSTYSNVPVFVPSTTVRADGMGWLFYWLPVAMD
ncbi:hypothetical protein BZA05DRAFT_402633 [Tricharina praecox]|uniref:uncharacterized protein n=1 Tax=Tricharina praecox TaxID=43433 RepID=UPI00221F1BBC|nr:uncharacterized protein BZA05DRAFT_402633 [Tricharina praecox]KAI5849228.1 hypothetical protein BZA05DRAFT_402633 [Tricharina praecox]